MDPKTALTPCEYEIFERMSLLGESQKEVAYNTHRSVLTVQATIRNAYAKLGINKATEAVLLYCAHTFDIAEQISSKQIQVFKGHVKEIISILLLCFCLTGVTLDQGDDVYRNRRRVRRRQETEIIVIRSHISA